MITSMTFKKKQNYGDSKMFSALSIWEAGSENIVYTIKMDTHHYTFVKTHRKCDTKSVNLDFEW